MEAKTFYSRLFKRKINPEDQDFWTKLYAELLHRIREIDDRNCFCHYCDADKAKFNRIISVMENDKLIEENEKPINFTGVLPCSRITKDRDEERAAEFAELRKKYLPRSVDGKSN